MMQVMTNPKTVVKIQPQERPIFNFHRSDLIDGDGTTIGYISIELFLRFDIVKVQVKSIGTQQGATAEVKAKDVADEIKLQRVIDHALAEINLVADWEQIMQGTKQATYALEQIKAAYWAEFHAKGELWFNYLGTDEENEDHTQTNWEMFVNKLEKGDK